MLDFIYRINSIIPPEPQSTRTFSVFPELDYEFAMKAREKEMDAKTRSGFKRFGRELIQKYSLARNPEFLTPYHFVEGSWFLHFCEVPGNACDLGLSTQFQHDFISNWERIKSEKNLTGRIVSYSPHNVDTKEQAFCLASLWLYWANNARDIIK
jgi:hypothetical protein